MSPADPSRRILVGRFGAPHGVRGDIRLQSFTQDAKAVAGYGPLTASDGRTFILTSVRTAKDNMLVARVAGIADRTAAAALTGLELTIGRSALPPPDEDEFYVADLVGFDVCDASGMTFGAVVDIPNYGSGDLVEVGPREGGETLLFPFTKAVVPVVDLAGRRITIVPPIEIEDEARPSD